MPKKSVVILSGGMDSMLCTALEIAAKHDVIAVHFNYTQRTMQKELEAFRAITSYFNITNTYEIDLDFFAQIGASALTDSSIDVPKHGIEEGIPVTYVPFRNGIFLSIAASIAEKESAQAIVIGAVEEDSSGYPDCSDAFLHALNSSINLGTKPTTSISIERPLVHLKKEQIVQEALKLNAPLQLTWSCYERSDKACGVCDSCRLRLKGFSFAGAKDPIAYV